VVREHLPAGEREDYDRYIGVSVYEPLPTQPVSRAPAV
jgi:hypothetical protein